MRVYLTNTEKTPGSSITIAASNSPATAKREATYICTGTDDQETIQTAIDQLTTGGRIQFSRGIYDISDTITITNPAVYLQGEGATGNVYTTGENSVETDTMVWV